MRGLTHRLWATVAVLALGGCDRASDDPIPSELDDHDFRESFVPVPDVGDDSAFPCHMLQQDCPAGDKCMPWGQDSPGTWDATRCSPVVADPARAGMPCTIEGLATSGIDDCERGTMCFESAPDERTCVPMMTGSDNHPVCADPMRYPLMGASGILPLCLPSCRPLDDDCPLGLGCYPTGYAFGCGPDASGGRGSAGDPCEFTNACTIGLVCVDGETVPECAGIGCCTPYCDTNRPSCPDGLTCQSWPGDETLRPGGESLGICLT